MADQRELLELALMAVGAFVAYVSRRQLVDGLNEAFDRFRGGGPRPPTHPLPANDRFLTLRKRRRT
jgi:hypothetical protein